MLVHSMDRLARNLDDLRAIVRQLAAKCASSSSRAAHLHWRRQRDGNASAERDGGVCEIREIPHP
ncbi:hypothetical protein C3B61_18545 [Cryobacterium zongtaii]|uniref:Resolvase/invertase-type recombinase catalytic domain-containing protein n=1 Tax=Cryobacterium zongtaii TaxID=1259217 RepID=A0A2S3Z973_9MICO|nr:hypothetical protein C3B61_18545 [Cryobacterium zongtaii]